MERVAIKRPVETLVERGFEPLHLTDRFGRLIGCKWSINHVIRELMTATEVAEAKARGDCYWLCGVDEPLDYIELDTQPTRNGHRYGASIKPRRVASVEAARELLVKHLAKVRKYNAKVHARTPASA